MKMDASPDHLDRLGRRGASRRDCPSSSRLGVLQTAPNDAARPVRSMTAQYILHIAQEIMHRPNHSCPTIVYQLMTYAFIIYVSGLAATLAAWQSPGAVPDLSGVWSPIPGAAVAQSSGAAALPQSDLTIEQTSDALLVSRTAFDQVTTLRYHFDGRDDRNKSGAATRVTRSRWDAGRLVIEGTASQVTSQGAASWRIREVYSRDAGGRLVVEKLWRGDDGVEQGGVVTYVRRAKS